MVLESGDDVRIRYFDPCNHVSDSERYHHIVAGRRSCPCLTSPLSRWWLTDIPGIGSRRMTSNSISDAIPSILVLQTDRQTC